MMKITKISYKGWENCVSISNDKVDVVVTTDVGPRIIRYGFVGEKNQFFEVPEHLGKVGEKEFRLYGGHRLWHSPEDINRTYVPDNDAVKWYEEEGFVVFEQEKEEFVNVQKIIKIRLDEKSSRVELKHFIKNVGAWPIRFAPWSITMMSPSGRGIMPMCDEDTGLVPNRTISLWSYTDLEDSRLSFKGGKISLDCDTSKKSPIKIGANITSGVAKYENQDVIFTKEFGYEKNVHYPDKGVNCEMYANDRYLELEALGKLQEVKVNDYALLEESWKLEKVM